jgi:hypothetical protein
VGKGGARSIAPYEPARYSARSRADSRAFLRVMPCGGARKSKESDCEGHDHQKLSFFFHFPASLKRRSFVLSLLQSNIRAEPWPVTCKILFLKAVYGA